MQCMYFANKIVCLWLHLIVGPLSQNSGE